MKKIFFPLVILKICFSIQLFSQELSIEEKSNIVEEAKYKLNDFVYMLNQQKNDNGIPADTIYKRITEQDYFYFASDTIGNISYDLDPKDSINNEQKPLREYLQKFEEVFIANVTDPVKIAIEETEIENISFTPFSDKDNNGFKFSIVYKKELIGNYRLGNLKYNPVKKEATFFTYLSKEDGELIRKTLLIAIRPSIEKPYIAIDSNLPTYFFPMKSYQIKWYKNNTSSNINIELWHKNKKVKTLASKINEDTFSWKPDENLISDKNYFIKIVTDDDNEILSDNSDLFKISDFNISFQDKIKFNKKAKLNFKVGENFSNDFLEISLFKGDTLKDIIGLKPINDLKFKWKPDSEKLTEGENYKYRFKVNSGENKFELFSKNFKIRKNRDLLYISSIGAATATAIILYIILKPDPVEEPLPVPPNPE